jgi:NAD-dependent SIR2 family protein deacetylase
VANDRTLRGIRQAAELIGKADALLITAGAGMGVDSGLPDFRGKEGFWREYPVFRERGISFERMAQPKWFFEDPETAWAFYGHRQQLYRETKPHDGFQMLLEWGRAMPLGYFVVTSNVDGQFETAGFAAERLLAVHGTLFAYQCLTPCRKETWRDDGPNLEIDLATMRTRGKVPRCPYCGGIARPNVLMFDDGAWVSKYRDSQRGRYRQWLAQAKGLQLVVVELGAGKAIPAIRALGEDVVARGLGALVRINPDASEADEPAIPIRMGALEALKTIDERVHTRLTDRRQWRAARALADERPGPDIGRGGAVLLPPVVAREMEIVAFNDAAPRMPQAPAWSRELPRHSDLLNTTFLDLVSGQVEPFNWLGIRTEDYQAVLDCWYAKGLWRYPPVPAIGGHVAPGFLVTGRAIQLPEAAARRSLGAAVLQICNSEKEPVLTLGMARRPIEGAHLWRMLYEEAGTHLTPLDVPLLPWIARRLDKAASRYTAMLPALQEIGRVMAWTWLRLQARKEKRGAEGDNDRGDGEESDGD